MRKLLVGIVVSAAVGVSACGKSDKPAPKTLVAETGAKKVQKVQNDASVIVNTRPAVPLETAEKTPRFTLVLSEGKSGFKFRSAMLSDDAKAKIDEMFTGDKIDLNNVRFEVEGYTDNLGAKEVNHQVGLARANAVKQYLGEQYEIPANWITVVSYGMEKPVADNSTPEGRARNRRVVIKVVD
jgi:peptidoglycan-associated lipoprotein